MSPFKVVGSLIIAWAVVILLYLPHGPHDGRTLSEYERIVAVWQISKNRTGVQRPKFLPYQIKEVPLDAKIYLLPLMAAALGILNGSVSNFMSTLIKGFGFPPHPPPNPVLSSLLFPVHNSHYLGISQKNIPRRQIIVREHDPPVLLW